MDKGKERSMDMVDCEDTLFLRQKLLFQVPRIQLPKGEFMILDSSLKKNIMILKETLKR